MPIAPITGIAGVGSGLAPTKPAAVADSGGDSFSNMLGNAIDKLDAGQNQAAQASQDLATGKASDVSSVVMDVERASLQLQLASQIRNKLVDAYQELMRMQV